MTRALSITVVLDTSICKLMHITSIKHETPTKQIGEKAVPNIVFTRKLHQTSQYGTEITSLHETLRE